VVKIQITVFEDESFTTSHIEDVFGFTAKNICVEVWLGRDNPSAALYRIGTGCQLCWLSDCCLPAYSRFVLAERIVQFLNWKPPYVTYGIFQLPWWPSWRNVRQPFCPSVGLPNISVESLTVVFTQDVLGSNIDPKTCLREGVFCSSTQMHQPLFATAQLNRPLPHTPDSYSLNLHTTSLMPLDPTTASQRIKLQ
jgi:hypothetical protein